MTQICLTLFFFFFACVSIRLVIPFPTTTTTLPSLPPACLGNRVLYENYFVLENQCSRTISSPYIGRESLLLLALLAAAAVAGHCSQPTRVGFLIRTASDTQTVRRLTVTFSTLLFADLNISRTLRQGNCCWSGCHKKKKSEKQKFMEKSSSTSLEAFMEPPPTTTTTTTRRRRSIKLQSFFFCLSPEYSRNQFFFLPSPFSLFFFYPSSVILLSISVNSYTNTHRVMKTTWYMI